MRTQLSDDGAILHIHIPMKLRRRGGRKVIIISGDPASKPASASLNEDTMVRALVKARRWQVMLEKEEVSTIKDLAQKEGVDKSFMARILRLNSLAPDIIDKILSGDYPDSISLESLRRGIPVSWKEQKVMFNML